MMSGEKNQLRMAWKELCLGDLSEETSTRLLHYLDLLEQWNCVYNLTSIRERSAMLPYHVFDGLSIVQEIADERCLLDVGSGGGVPGMVVAMARPDLEVTLLDANSKKTAFLRQALIELSLNSVRVETTRVEQFLSKGFDYIVSRAFSQLSDFVSLTRHLLNKDGRWLAMKGGYPHEELQKLPSWIEVIDVKKLEVPQLNAVRHLVILCLSGE
jgi:16S rRNA methyltransferase gidB